MALFYYKEKKNKGIRAAAYLRLSIEDGDKAESNSIGNQRELIQNFVAERPELHLVGEYADDGYTGTNFERPGFTQMMEDIQSDKINCIIVKDFYVNKLGFAIVRENFRKERNDWKLDLRVGEGADAIELEIFAEPNPPKRVNRPEACGLRHLAFRVEDVEATVAELEQMGIGCEPIRLDSYTQKKMTFFFDPDGLPLELHE